MNVIVSFKALFSKNKAIYLMQKKLREDFLKSKQIPKFY